MSLCSFCTSLCVCPRVHVRVNNSCKAASREPVNTSQTAGSICDRDVNSTGSDHSSIVPIGSKGKGDIFTFNSLTKKNPACTHNYTQADTPQRSVLLPPANSVRARGGAGSCSSRDSLCWARLHHPAAGVQPAECRGRPPGLAWSVLYSHPGLSQRKEVSATDAEALSYKPSYSEINRYQLRINTCISPRTDH